MAVSRAFVSLLCFGLFECFQADENTPMCITNTGGSCLTTGCNAVRGPTECNSLKQCMCQSGGAWCSGADGSCYNVAQTPYQIVGEPNQFYRIFNARWPDEYLYVSSAGPLWYSTDSGTPQGAFQFVVPPSGGANVGVLVYTQEWPSSAFDFSVTSDKNGQTYNLKSIYVSGGVQTFGTSIQITNILSEFIRAPQPSARANKTMFMITGYNKRYIVPYIPSVSATLGAVSGYSSDPGWGGYWYFDPEPPAWFTSRFLSYSGSQCSFMCGSNGSPGSGNKALVIISIAVLLRFSNF